MKDHPPPQKNPNKNQKNPTQQKATKQNKKP